MIFCLELFIKCVPDLDKKLGGKVTVKNLRRSGQKKCDLKKP